MRIKALFFKTYQENKFYESEYIDVPQSIVNIEDSGRRYYSARKYIKDNRNTFGYNDMILVLPASTSDEIAVIGCPMMVMPKEDDNMYSDDEIDEMCKFYEEKYIDNEHHFI